MYLVAYILSLLFSLNLRFIERYIFVDYIGTAAVGFTQIPLIPLVLDILIPQNESRPSIMFVRAAYMFDTDKHFFKLYIFYVIASITTGVAFVCTDSTFTIIMHQILGMFAIVQ